MLKKRKVQRAIAVMIMAAAAMVSLQAPAQASSTGILTSLRCDVLAGVQSHCTTGVIPANSSGHYIRLFSVGAFVRLYDWQNGNQVYSGYPWDTTVTGLYGYYYAVAADTGGSGYVQICNDGAYHCN
ncbi:hypothetical protein AB0M46_26995 [Dactylosporangium sp. NPDC051485]|uniref:hypothetical protein n=1 Tax=Dactylosporangium sp. NPDC051485 TaxID=3154846 RepID=UPI0034378854